MLGCRAVVRPLRACWRTSGFGSTSLDILPVVSVPLPFFSALDAFDILLHFGCGLTARVQFSAVCLLQQNDANSARRGVVDWFWRHLAVWHFCSCLVSVVIPRVCSLPLRARLPNLPLLRRYGNEDGRWRRRRAGAPLSCRGIGTQRVLRLLLLSFCCIRPLLSVLFGIISLGLDGRGLHLGSSCPVPAHFSTCPSCRCHHALLCRYTWIPSCLQFSAWTLATTSTYTVTRRDGVLLLRGYSAGALADRLPSPSCCAILRTPFTARHPLHTSLPRTLLQDVSLPWFVLTTVWSFYNLCLRMFALYYPVWAVGSYPY